MKAIILSLAFLIQAYAAVSFRPAANRIEVLVDGKPFTSLYYGPEWPQPFLHPLRTASGIRVTRGYPVEPVEGESRDHNWHHGLWYAHGLINGVDFWRDKGAEITGRIVPIAEPQENQHGIRGSFQLIAPGNRKVGSIEQSFSFGGDQELRIVDVHVVIHADQGVPIRMGDTEEGALGIRFRDEFREDHGAVLSNADGLTGSKNIWGKRAKWVDYSTSIGEDKVGVTLLDHPKNPKYPTYWHARNYGLCAANPFGEHDFLHDKSRDGSLTIPAGGSVAFRYRVVIHPGMLDPAKAAEWFQAWTKEKESR